MKLFPLRTLLLMVMALVAFVRLYCVTHSRFGAQRQTVEMVPIDPKPR